MLTHQDRVYRYLTNWTRQCIRSHCRIHIKRLIIVIEPTRELPFMAVYCVIVTGVQSVGTSHSTTTKQQHHQQQHKKPRPWLIWAVTLLTVTATASRLV